MDKKILLFIFLLFNILAFVCAADETGGGVGGNGGEVPPGETDPENPGPGSGPGSGPGPDPDPNPENPSADPNPTADPNPIPDPTPSPTPIEPGSSVTTTTPIITPPDDGPTNSPEPPDEGTKITQKTLDETDLYIKPKNTTALPTPPMQVTTTVEKKQTHVKSYPQSKYVPDDDNDGTPLEYLSLLYIMSGLISTLLVIFTTYTIYKKGLGNENNISNNTKTWGTEFEDDGYRNKSTISRSTLTPSIRNATLGSPSSNPSYFTNPTNPTNIPTTQF